MKFDTKEQQTSSIYTSSIIYTLDDISDKEIFPLTKGRTFYVSKPWLLAIERLRGGKTAYIVIRNSRSELLGMLPIYWGKPSERGYYDPYNRFLKRSGGNFKEEDWNPSLILGSRAAYSCEFLIDYRLSDDDQEEILRNMLKVARNFSVEKNTSSVSALYINKSGYQQLKKVDVEFPFFISGANAVIDVKWDTFDEYLSSLSTQSRREYHVFHSKGYQIISTALKGAIEELATLFSSHERKYGHKASSESEAKELETLASTSNEFSRVLLLELSGRVVGGILLFNWEDTIYCRSVGFDLDIVTGKTFEYFNLAYYEVMRIAIANGYSHIDYGMSTYRAKMQRGARVEPLYGLVDSKEQLTPFSDHTFTSWNNLRNEAIDLQDITLIEGRKLP